MPSLVIDALEKKPIDFDLLHKYVDAWIGSTNIGHLRTLSSVLDEYVDPTSRFVLHCQQPAASDLEGGEGGWWDRRPSTLSTGFPSDLLTDPSGQ